MAADMTMKTQMVATHPFSGTSSQDENEGKRGPRHNTLPTLPTDLIFPILTRVPAAFVYNLRSVDKSWFDLICSNPSFIQANLLQAKQNPGWIMEIPNTFKGKGMFDTYLMKLEDGGFVNQNINITHHARVTVLASCNGLLLMKKRSNLYVTNPVTKQQMRLPHHGLRHNFERYAFAFASSTMKYKVLFNCTGTENDVCRILTLGSNTWNEIQAVAGLPDMVIEIDDFHLSINGIVYWKRIFCRRQTEQSYILSVDANTEKFRVTELPQGICTSNGWSYSNRFVEMRGQLAFMNSPERYSQGIHIWLLEDPENGIWRRQQSIDVSHLCARNIVRTVNGVFIQPVLSLKEGKIIIFVEFRNEIRRFIALEMETNRVTFMDVPGYIRKHHWIPHVMSLVPPRNP